MSLARFKPLYVSLHVANTAYNPDTDVSSFVEDNGVNVSPSTLATINATVNQVYNDPVVDKASDYLVAIERMEISLNGIPFYDASDNEAITIRWRATDEKVDDFVVNVTDNAYSLTHLLNNLNDLTYKNPKFQALDDANLDISFSLTGDGFISLTCEDTFEDFFFIFPRKLNMILGISKADQIEEEGVIQILSTYPRIDLGDDLDHLVISTNLPVKSDTLGNVKKNVMTDFSVPSNYGNNFTYTDSSALYANSVSSNIRQKAIYIPNERRYLELVGDFPIQQITLECEYVDPSHKVKKVPILFGGIFEIKLGFYLKS